MFILGVWIWNHHVGEVSQYSPGTSRVALVKIDRDLRLAEAMRDAPAWLKHPMGVRSPEQARHIALKSLGQLSVAGQLGVEGLQAYATLLAVERGSPIRSSLSEVFQGDVDVRRRVRELEERRGFWWDARLVDELAPSSGAVAPWRIRYREQADRLVMRVFIVRSAAWALVLGGLAFIPRVLVLLRGGLWSRCRGYAARWTFSLGLVVFVMATLAWIGFGLALDIGVGALPRMHALFALFLDSVARLLPCLIALGLLFTRPAHAVRVLGINRPFEIRTLLGAFSLLSLVDLAIRLAFSDAGPSHPAGGLQPSDAGLWGLVLVVVSACLLAPFTEEILYRGVLFHSSRNRLGVPTAAVFSSLVFALLHFYDLQGMLGVAAFGIASALLYAATRSLGLCVTLHVLHNAAVKIPDWVIYHAAMG